MTFTQLEIFSLVAELHGFTATAERLQISQSAVSHALKSLEKEWGVVLLERGPCVIELTDIGRQLLGHVREILGVKETIRQEISAVSGLKGGVLRIGSFGPTSSLKVLPAILKEYRGRFPGIDVLIDEGKDDEVSRWLLERRIDVGFTVLPDDRFDTVPLLEDQLVALVPVNSKFGLDKAVRLSELSQVPFIMTTAGSSNLVEHLFSEAGVAPLVKHRFSQILTILKMVEAGEGVSVVAELALPEDMASRYPGIAVKPLTPRARRPIGLAVRSIDQSSPALKEFLATAKAVLGKLR